MTEVSSKELHNQNKFFMSIDLNLTSKTFTSTKSTIEALKKV